MLCPAEPISEEGCNVCISRFHTIVWTYIHCGFKCQHLHQFTEVRRGSFQPVSLEGVSARVVVSGSVGKSVTGNIQTSSHQPVPKGRREHSCVSSLVRVISKAVVPNLATSGHKGDDICATPCQGLMRPPEAGDNWLDVPCCWGSSVSISLWPAPWAPRAGAHELNECCQQSYPAVTLRDSPLEEGRIWNRVLFLRWEMAPILEIRW